MVKTKRRHRRHRASALPGIVAGELCDYELPDFSAIAEDALPPLVESVVARAADNYWRWAEQVKRTGHCCRPIRLRGRVQRADRATGELRTVYSTDGEPNNELLVACGNRRASRCRSCSAWYRGDAFQIVASGIRGGKGVPESVATHPMLFVTFTAPSFGAVHAHRPRNGRSLPCHPRDRHRRCPHGRPMGCSVRHKATDPALGQAICPQCFDHEALVVWNASVPALWKRTTTNLARALARSAGMSEAQFRSLVRLRFAKVAEYQRRGAIHLHAVIRLDAAASGEDGQAVAPPPERFDLVFLEAGIRSAQASTVVASAELAVLDRGDVMLRWGQELDVRPIVAAGGMASAHVVAAYLSKYAVKSSEALGVPDQPIESDADVDKLDVSPHVRALVRAAWVLGWRHEFEGLGLREHAHGLGFGGHFLTKSRRYSTTFGALNDARREYAHRRDAVDLEEWGPPEDDDQGDVLAKWAYVGWGYRTIGEAYLASSAAAAAREERRVAREELSSRVA